MHRLLQRKQDAYSSIYSSASLSNVKIAISSHILSSDYDILSKSFNFDQDARDYMADIIAVDVLFNVYHTLEATNLDRSKECLCCTPHGKALSCRNVLIWHPFRLNI